MIGRAAMRVWLLLALVLGGAGAANAQSFFNFSYSSSGVSVMGTFVTTAQANGQYLINSILNGTRGGIPMVLLPPGSGYFSSNNILFFPANPFYVDERGFSFSAGGNSYDLVSIPEFNAYVEFDESNIIDNTIYGNLAEGFMVVAVPAPLPGGGLLSFLALGLAGLAYRRRTILAYARALLAGFGLRAAPRPA